MARALVLLVIVWVGAALPVSGQAVRAPLSFDVPSVDELARRAVERRGARPGMLATTEAWGTPSRLRGSPLSPRPPAPDGPPRFQHALLGSAIGVTVSVGMLYVLSDADLSDRTDRRRYGGDGELRAQGAALLLIVGSAPIGAVLGAGLVDDGLPGEALFAAGLGELVVGGMGALAGIGGAALLGGGPPGQRVGAGIGAGLGAAVGAALGATLSARDGRGALSFRGGAWSVGVPDVAIRPRFRHDSPVAVHVPLLTATL
ncbi:hypothetical protein GGQ20_002198 [Salinibacter ruber]|uniref:hypothetical protein n=1 Tax=Salinibacter ruber TaxID=146919 RepID=UPI0013C37646|nr:hypothetical protein [Salinibacter ruber]MCS3700881.1 hypothetical protein [Salinibacter ruber]